ncbi:MAG TPA: hypothetical protein VM513_17340 [Kofleriaceae bacterium]|nr:hypothetical protein [Kofleriaceae bacterium]
MTARAPRRALRVAVLLGDQLVEERVFPHGAPVTFGHSLRCALSVPGDGIPEAHTLFTPSGRDAPAGALLRVTANMHGRLAHGEHVRTELHDGPGDHGVWTIALEPGARGRLQVGDVTVLFQDFVAPAAAPRPVLPASLRGTLADRIDRRLAAVIGASLVAHLGIAAYAWMTDAEEPSLLAPSLASTYRHEAMDVVLPDEPPAPPETSTADASGPPTAGAASPVAPSQTPAPIVTSPRPAARPATPSVSDADIARFASLLSGPGETAAGTRDTMRDRKPGADLDTQLADVRGRALHIGDDGRTFREEPGPRLGTDVRPLVDDPTRAPATDPKHDERDPPRVIVRPVPGRRPPVTTLTVELVLDKINKVYMSGLARCYRKGLTTDATLTGKVAISFTVTERGSLDDTSAGGVTPEVDACIAQLMTGWRFPIPRDKQGEPDTASFQLVLALQPS